MNEPIRVLFLCTGNSCRSQMAEGWARRLSEGLVIARSAGLESHGQNPRAITAMNEAGVDIGGQASNRLVDADLEWADLVVTVCGHADEHCPILPPDVAKRHWPLSDPARFVGTEDEIAAVFRAARDEIRELVTILIREIRAGGAEA